MNFPITAAGTDFSTWKRENLGMLAVELTAKVVKQREKLSMSKILAWDFDGKGQWEATSRYHDDDLHFTYLIGCCEDGTFDVSESDRKLLGKKNKPNCFDTLEDAKQYCDFLERSYDGD